jgi:type II secretory pathway pseudopilin PulG
MTRIVRSQAGETLVEVMMTVAIVSFSLVAILSGLGASMRFSASHRGSANAAVAVVAAADAVKTWTGGSATCGTLTTSTYATALSGVTNLPSGWSTANLSISAASCITVNGVSRARVTVVATSPDGQSIESVDVVRRSLT